MKHPQRFDFAIHALWHMAHSANEEIVLLKDIAEHQGISESYLAKVFQSLAKTDLVVSLRGKYGGYRLGRLAKDISIGDIYRVIGEDPWEFECNHLARGCSLKDDGCLLPTVFEEAKRRMYEVLDAVSLADMSARLGSEAERVEWLSKQCAGSIDAQAKRE